MDLHTCYPGRSWYWLTGPFALIAAGAILAFPLSYISGSNVLIGCCLLPFSVFLHGNPRINYLYLAVSATMTILAQLYGVRIFYFFALALYVLFLLEAWAGRASALVLFLLVFMSPFFEQVAVITGFPVRLHLSEWAGNILAAAGLNIVVKGNMIVLDGTMFTVDEACMGLHLLSISMMMGVFILGHSYRSSGQTLSFMFLIVFFLHVFVLNLAANLVRIIILVTLKIQPDNPMHDAAGILCLLMYVMVPLYYLSRWMTSRFGKPLPPRTPPLPMTLGRKIFVSGFSLVLLLTGVMIRQTRTNAIPEYAKVGIEGLEPVHLEGGITKFFDDRMLVYVKPIPEFFTAEHTPLICWKGSGYRFEHISKTQVNNIPIFTGRLVKGNDSLYTAWWFDNGAVRTIDQLEWRIRMLKGEQNFCLINVTSQDEGMLMRQLEWIFADTHLRLQNRTPRTGELLSDKRVKQQS